MIILQIIQIFSGSLYKILGPQNSTRLSQSIFGKKLLSLIVGENVERVYSGKYGVRLRLSKDEAISSGLLHLGTINPYETNIIRKILISGDTFIDIGAYVDGWHSIIASKVVGKNGCVYTFEPVPEYFNKLLVNIKLNRLKNVKAENISISDRQGKLSFYIGGLASSFYKDHLKNSKDKIEEVKVNSATLDSYIGKNKLKNIRLIKIDVEGAELNVINGAKKILSRADSPDLMMEVKEDYLKHGKTTEKELLIKLKKLGYKMYFITDKGLEKKSHQKRELMNVYFSKKDPKNLPIV